MKQSLFSPIFLLVRNNALVESDEEAIADLSRAVSLNTAMHQAFRRENSMARKMIASFRLDKATAKKIAQLVGPTYPSRSLFIRVAVEQLLAKEVGDGQNNRSAVGRCRITSPK